jgi:hypothetical protein
LCARPPGLHRIVAEGDAGCGLSAYRHFSGAPVDTGPSAAVWQKRLTDLSPLPPLFDPDPDRYSVGTAGPTPNSQTGSPRDSARREQRGLREPPGQPADVHIFQHGRATFRGVESGV